VKLLRKFFSKLTNEKPPSFKDHSLSDDSRYSAKELGRRKFLRIHFPRGTGKGELPEILLDHGTFDIVNLSLGGAALSPALGSQIRVPSLSEELKLVFVWKSPHVEIVQKAKFCGVRHEIWAFEFVEPSSELMARLTQLLEPGVEGTKMVSVSPLYFKPDESLLEWYRSPLGTEIVIRGANVDENHQADVYLREFGIFWSQMEGLKTARMEAQRGFNPDSQMRNMSESPYFIYNDDEPNTDLIAKFFLIAQNIPSQGPALKVFLREVGKYLREHHT